MAIEVLTKIRRFIAGKSGMSPIVARSTGCESLAVAYVEAEGHELNRAGKQFYTAIGGATTGRVSVVAQVTTAPQWSVWNNDYQKSYIITEIGAMITSGILTAGSGVLIQAALFQAPARVGANTANVIVVSGSNGGGSSKAIIQSQATALTITTPASPVYYTVAYADPTNLGVSTDPSIAVINRDIRGGIIIPPQNGMAINVYTTATGTPLFVPYVSWVELELDLE